MNYRVSGNITQLTNHYCLVSFMFNQIYALPTICGEE